VKQIRKMLLFFLVILTGCVPQSTSVPTPRIQPTLIPPYSVFNSSNECPDICWLGIHPGKTTVDEAFRIVQDPSQFNQKFLKKTDTVLEAYWQPKNMKYESDIYMLIEDGLVKSMTISELFPFTVNDMIQLFGQPTGISFWTGINPEAITSEYTIYFPSLKAKFWVRIGKLSGPKSRDYFEAGEIGSGIQDQPVLPWLGYKNIEDYFPNGTPTPHPQTP
jgi:hypothetical protein